jgi:SAM-dependent methyltransferase
MAADWPDSAIDTSTPHPARVYDYLIGGKDNFPADREVGEGMASTAPEIRDMARANRSFLGRAVRYLSGQGIRQFLDVGTGLPTAGNTHEVAQSLAPDSNVVYVDNDPLVIAHGRALLAGNERTSTFQADLRQPDVILGHPDVARLIDFSRPVGILLVAVLHFVPDTDEPFAIVERFKSLAAPGSHLVISHVAQDIKVLDTDEMHAVYHKTSNGALRTREEVEEFFDGFPLVEPGLVQVPLWRPDGEVPADLGKFWIYGGVGKKG